ncbi:hypothetical protein ACEPAH_7891 [Sanghuangporus vaninii]
MSEERSSEELLQSALSSAFTPVPIESATPASPNVSAREPAAEASAPAPASKPLVSQEDLARYEEERLALDRSWKEESAVRRREAEERRARIAAERGTQNAEEEADIKGPPNPIFNPRPAQGKEYPNEPSIADVRDVISGEPSGTRQRESSAQVSPPTTATLEHSQRWEDIEAESLGSSYPSLSYPEHSHSESASAPSSEHGPLHSRGARQSSAKEKSSGPEKASPKQGEAEGPVPVPTLSIFDSRLSTRSRLIALFSSLTINLFLPFVNGVMLGFGEIFARNMAVRFFGLKAPGSASGTPGGAATAVGVRAAGADPDRRKR